MGQYWEIPNNMFGGMLANFLRFLINLQFFYHLLQKKDRKMLYLLHMKVT
jgi:hypothetical protein